MHVLPHSPPAAGSGSLAKGVTATSFDVLLSWPTVDSDGNKATRTRTYK